MNLMTRYRAMSGVKKGGELPAGYTPLEYLRNTDSSNYIDTGIEVGDGFCAEVEFRLNSYDGLFGNNGVIGGGYFNSNNCNYFMVQNQKFAIRAGSDDHNTGVQCALNTWYNVKFSTSQGNHFLYVNNELLYSSTATSPNVDKNIYLFGWVYNYGGTNAKCDIRKAVIYGQSDTLLTMPTTNPIWKYTPCYNDGYSLGVFDTVSQDFIVPSNSLRLLANGDYFVKGKDVNTHNLPAAYQEVDSITVFGQGYFDTGITCTNLSTVEIKLFAPDTNNERQFFGYRAGTPRFVMQTNNLGQGNYFSSGWGNQWINNNLSLTNPATRVCKMDKGTYYIDGNVVATYNQETFTAGGVSYLFWNNGGGEGNRFRGVWEYMKHSENDVLTNHYVPCYRISDGKIGRYNLIDNTFDGGTI